MKKKYYLLLLLIGVGQFVSAQIVNIPDANFKNALVNGVGNAFLYGDCCATNMDVNNDGEIQVSEAENVRSLLLGYEDISSLQGLEAFVNLKILLCTGNPLQSIDVSNNPLLETLNLLNCGLNNLDVSQNNNLITLRCYGNQLTSLDVSQKPNLETLICNDNNLTSLNISQTPSLNFLDCKNNELTSIDLSQSPTLEIFECNYNQITALDVTNNPNLLVLRFRWNLVETIDLTQNPNLSSLNCYYNRLTQLDISQNPNMYTVFAEFNMLTSLDVSQNLNLNWLNCTGNDITELDLTNNSNLNTLNCSYNDLQMILMKNGGISSELDFSNNSNLAYICVDEEELQQINDKLIEYGQTNSVTVNTYCSFTPGGTFYTVSGEAKLDANADGCDINDEAFPNISFSITNGSDTGIFTADTTGNYSIPVQAGTHTITPQLENPTYFTVSPTNITVDFPTDVSPNIQDFCITPNGTYNDLEITIIPLEQARPGFDTDYKIIYENKGTTTLSGTVSFTFDDDFMDVVTTNPTSDSQSTGSLSWNYTNLTPFETRSIVYTMNLNTPTDANFPLNGDDELSFTGTVTPTVSDETPEDNVIVLEQIVVNSFDPNDKTCLEGNTITEDKVGDFVHYLIRFENTGTASAINVVVKDDIDAASYDISTLSVIDGSHDFVTRVEGQKVEFVFENINLPFDDATNDGYVLFKIKTKSTLVANDTFMNKAEIFFDFNAPIITNDEMTLVSAPLSTSEVSLDTSIEAYPKPTNDIVYIKGKHSIKTIELYTLQGRQILSKALLGNQRDTNISMRTFSKGLYILKVTSDKGVFIDKIIKQ